MFKDTILEGLHTLSIKNGLYRATYQQPIVDYNFNCKNDIHPILSYIN